MSKLYRVERVVSGYAYPRNGNAHNPTPRVSWLSYVGDKFVGRSATRRDAIALCKAVIAEGAK